MKAFTNANPRDLTHAVTLIRDARQANRTVAIAGGGSDLLGMMKDRLVAPDVLVSLKSIKGLDQVKPAPGGGVTIGGLITLDALSRVAAVRERYAVLTEAAEGVATPQIRNAATLGQHLPAAVVLVLPERLQLPEERRRDLLLDLGREPVPRDLRRRAELHRAPLGHGAGAGRPRRDVPDRRARR